MNLTGSSVNMRWLFYWIASITLATLVVGSLLAYRHFVERPITYGETHLTPMPHIDRAAIGANTFLHLENDPEKIQRELAVLRSAGIGMIRQQFLWEEIEESGKGNHINYRDGSSSWARYDRIVEAANEAGIEILARLERPPRWAVTEWDRELPGSQHPPDHLKDFGDFVAAVVDRYRGDIRYFQIWNEPNLWGEWGESNPDAAEYAEMLKVAHTRAKEANPNAVIVLAGLAPTIERGPRNLSDTLFLERLYILGAHRYFDIAATMSYGLLTGPHDIRVSETRTNFPRALLWREIMLAYNDAETPIWATEYGWMSLPDNWQGNPGIWGNHPPDRQSRWTVEGIHRARAEWPWMSTIFIWASRWPNETHPDDPTPWFRLMDRDFSPRQSLEKLKEANGSGPVAGTGIHQEVNQAYIFDGPWPREIAKDASLGFWRTTGQAGAKMTFRFEGDRVSLLTYRGPTMGTARIRIDQNDSLPDLVPKNSRGQAIIDLYAVTPESEARIPIASGLPSGTHVLELTATGLGNEYSGGGEIIVDAVIVSVSRPSWPYVLTALSCLPLILGIAGLCLHSLWRRCHKTLQTIHLYPQYPSRHVAGIPVGSLITASLGAVLLWSLPNGEISSTYTMLRILVLIYLTLLAIKVPSALALTTAGSQFFHVLQSDVGPYSLGIPELMLGTMLVAWTIRNLYSRNFHLDRSWIFYAGLLLLLTAVIASIFAPYPKFALRSLRSVFVEPFLLFILLATYLDRRHARALLASVAIGGIVTALIALSDPLTDRLVITENLSRLRGLYGSPNNLGLLLERTLPLLSVIAITSHGFTTRILWWIGTLIVAMVLLASGSRGAWLATAFAMCLGAFPLWQLYRFSKERGLSASSRMKGHWLRRIVTKMQQSSVREKAAGFSIIFAILLGIILALPLGFDSLVALLRIGDQSGQTRLWIWESAWQMISKWPWWGIGPDNFLYLNTTFISPKGWREPNLSHPHNLFLDSWLSTGVLGLLAMVILLGCFYLALHKAYRSGRSTPDQPMILASMMAMSAGLVHGLVDNFYFLPELAGIFWILMAFAILISRERPLASGGPRALSHEIDRVNHPGRKVPE